MRSFRNIKSISLLILSSSLIVACGSGSDDKQLVYEPSSISGNTQGTTYTIITDNKKILDLQPEIDAILLDFDRCLSSYRDSSIVSIFTKGEAGSYAFEDINHYFVRCFKESEAVYRLSGGAFDPSVFPLVSAWGFMKNPALDLRQDQVDSLKNLVGFQANRDYSLEVHENQKNEARQKFTLTKLRPTLQLDFNAIAQGLAVDVLCEFLDAQSIENYYVEIGGELRVKGVNKEGNPWRIGIDVADEKNSTEAESRQLQAVIAVKNKAVATSGSYRKFYEKDGVKRSHTIDPRTGYPVQHSLLSATVLADNTARADAMATVFMVLGLEKSIEFVQQHKELKIEILLQYADQSGAIKTYYSPGMLELLLQ